MQTTLHHNTTQLDASDLVVANKKAYSQQELILRIFEKYPKKEFTPLSIWRITDRAYRETSIRRAITNLTSMGLLEKTGNKVKEEYGAINFTWRLAIGQTRLIL